jgi:hypothetical protein
MPWRWLLAIVAIGVITPSLIILVLDVAVAGTPIGTALSAVAAAQFAEGENLFLIAVLGLFPFLVLDSVLVLAHLVTRDLARIRWMAIAGLIGILVMMIPGHVLVSLPLYTGAHASSTGAIAYFFIPIYCCVTATIALGAAEILLRASRRQRGATRTSP